MNKGKIVQVFDKVKYDSDVETNNEYGIIDLRVEKWRILSENIILNLKSYFDELRDPNTTLPNGGKLPELFNFT